MELIRADFSYRKTLAAGSSSASSVIDRHPKIDVTLTVNQQQRNDISKTLTVLLFERDTTVSQHLLDLGQLNEHHTWIGTSMPLVSGRGGRKQGNQEAIRKRWKYVSRGANSGGLPLAFALSSNSHTRMFWEDRIPHVRFLYVQATTRTQEPINQKLIMCPEVAHVQQPEWTCWIELLDESRFPTRPDVVKITSEWRILAIRALQQYVTSASGNKKRKRDDAILSSNGDARRHSSELRGAYPYGIYALFLILAAEDPSPKVRTCAANAVPPEMYLDYDVFRAFPGVFNTESLRGFLFRILGYAASELQKALATAVGSGSVSSMSRNQMSRVVRCVARFLHRLVDVCDANSHPDTLPPTPQTLDVLSNCISTLFGLDVVQHYVVDPLITRDAVCLDTQQEMFYRLRHWAWKTKNFVRRMPNYVADEGLLLPLDEAPPEPMTVEHHQQPVRRYSTRRFLEVSSRSAAARPRRRRAAPRRPVRRRRASSSSSSSSSSSDESESSFREDDEDDLDAPLSFPVGWEEPAF